MSACIVWTGAFHDGYPMIGSRRAHRVAFEDAHGPIPHGHVVHHECDTKACVNPEHLTTMTPREHMLLHRSWEKSQAARQERTTCKYGHPFDGFRRDRQARYCRTCHRAEIRRRTARRRLSAWLPQTPVLGRAAETDERVTSFVEDVDGGLLETEGGDDA